MRTVGAVVLFCLVTSAAPLRGQLFISEYLANPSGTDSPFEFVELIATERIDFSMTPYAVVFADNGDATANGWIEGGAITYGFSLTTGVVLPGEVVYVGGSSMAPTGRKLRTINTLTTPGDHFGTARNGVLGNGGNNADGIAVFNHGITCLTPSTIPIDAIFFGSGTGSAVVNNGADGYQLPVTELYSGGKLQAPCFVVADPPGGTFTAATGTYDVLSGRWLTPRTFTFSDSLTDGISTVAVVPEPPGLLVWGGLALLSFFWLRWRR